MRRSRSIFVCLVALALSVAAVFTSLPLSAIAEGVAAYSDTDVSNDSYTGEKKVVITHGGAAKPIVTIREDGKEELGSALYGINAKTRSWQIFDPISEKWIAIYGRTAETLPVSYALVGSMLNSSGRAYIRLKVTDDKTTYISDTVEIDISYDTGVAEEHIAANNNRRMLKASRAASDPGEGEFGTYQIIINYIFDDGSLAYEPHGATVAAGSNISDLPDVVSQPVLGYDPYRRIGDEYVPAPVVSFAEYTEVTEDIIINIIYKPAMTDFQVHHHYQDVIKDEYSLTADDITYYQGLTGSLVPDGLAKTEAELPGFKALAYERLEIAADGSTVIEIRYDRNYYLVNFDMKGGFGTDPVYTRYGSKVGANNPTRHGYIFDGWELVSYNGETPTAEQKSMYDINSTTISVPNANLEYRARWITQLTTYTMVFWQENIHDNGFSYWGHINDVAAMSGTFVNGADRVREAPDAQTIDVDQFTYCDVLTDKNVLVEGDGSTIVNVYYTRNRYTITFKAPGLCVIEENHRHTLNECYLQICGLGHIHSSDCEKTLNCPVEEHTAHTDNCIVCGMSEHSHSSSCCGLEEHRHVKECYNSRSVGNAATVSGAPIGVENGYIHRVKSGWRNYYYIYIDGIWYSYTGSNASQGDIVDPVCKKTEHTHGSDGCACDLVAHSHTLTCYRDILHTHIESCYDYSCGTVEHIHTDACYILNCGMPEGHTHSSDCLKSSSTNTVKLVYRKYQQNLGKDPDDPDNPDEGIWPIKDDNGVLYNTGQRWEPEGSSIYSAVLVYVANMPGENFTLKLNTSSNDTYVMNYYLEVLPSYAGEVKVVDGKRFILYTTISANYNYITKAEDFFDINGYVQYKSDPAFGSNGQIDINRGGTVNMYYLRSTSQKLEFRSNGTVLDDKTQTGIQYGEKLSEYNFVPEYPDTLEPNAYFFDGWYTTPGHFDGTEVDWEKITMAAGDMMLYAKWSPITHTVKVYLKDDLAQQIGDVQHVPHGNFASVPEEDVSNGNYIFQGWFYKEYDGISFVEKAFVFTGIPVLEDMVIYAKWSSHVSVTYTINYVLKSTREPIAPSETGSAIAGHNKTFYAKTGDELNEGFTTGFYPVTSSHTVTMSADGNHSFDFEYVYAPHVPYAVRYLDEDGNALAEEQRYPFNSHSVVTETFIRIPEMMPDAYQKRLILSAEGPDEDGDGIVDSNVITFRYTKNLVNAYYRVVHYIQNISGDGYREYRSEEKIGNIGQIYSVAAITLNGFTFNGQLTEINNELCPTETNEISAELGSEGLLFELYYDRANVTYTVNYIELATGKVVYPQKEMQGIFGAQVVEYAPGLDEFGYGLVKNEVGIKTITLNNSTKNEINFYYQENVYSLKYQIIGLPGAGQLLPESENVTAVTGVPIGSLPTISHGYHFVGWYLDEACTHPVDESWVDADTHRISPKSGGIWKSNHTYYIRIDPDFTTLTVNTVGAYDIDDGQTFIFRIRGNDETTASVDVTVAIVGNASVTIEKLRIGSYTVTEINSWSTRYDPDAEEKTIELSVNASANVVTFYEVRVENKWLDGNDTR